jgi:hypothetical protein
MHALTNYALVRTKEKIRKCEMEGVRELELKGTITKCGRIRRKWRHASFE